MISNLGWYSFKRKQLSGPKTKQSKNLLKEVLSYFTELKHIFEMLSGSFVVNSIRFS